MSMEQRIPATPQAWPETKPYWSAANEGRLLLKRCEATGKAFFYPREHSPFTGGPTDWIEASGKGVIYTFSVLPRAQPPYCIAYVTLAEGPTVLTNILTEDFESLRIGLPVRVEFVASQNGQRVPMFVPD
jgi:uncharacterized protein